MEFYSHIHSACLFSTCCISYCSRPWKYSTDWGPTLLGSSHCQGCAADAMCCVACSCLDLVVPCIHFVSSRHRFSFTEWFSSYQFRDCKRERARSAALFGGWRGGGLQDPEVFGNSNSSKLVGYYGFPEEWRCENKPWLVRPELNSPFMDRLPCPSRGSARGVRSKWPKKEEQGRAARGTRGEHCTHLGGAASAGFGWTLVLCSMRPAC